MKKTITRIYGDQSPLIFHVDLREINKTITDIDDVFFQVKNVKTDADDLLLFKKKSLMEITTASESPYVKVSVLWDGTEYDNFVVGNKYIAGLFCKFTGFTLANENVDTEFVFTVTQDFSRA